MRRSFRALGTLAIGLAIATTAHARGDAERGKKLYMDNCLQCHDTGIHTRPDIIIFSKKALRKRVEFCDANAGSNFSAQDLTDVTEWLNSEFYKYDD